MFSQKANVKKTEYYLMVGLLLLLNDYSDLSALPPPLKLKILSFLDSDVREQSYKPQKHELLPRVE
jgi:hypothetical protein